jgi:hypothetical protein
MTRGSLAGRQFLAFVLSGIFPGLGQFYNGQRAKGAAFLVGGGVLGWLAGRATPTDLSMPIDLGFRFWAPVLLLLALWLWSVIDAIRVAGRTS